jgi:hypothetical protein
MAFNKTMTLVALGASLLAAGAAFAGPEAGHPNIIAAREHAQMAIEKLKAAQVANEYDMGGHAAKAEKLLREAEEQMRLAAEAANKHK